MKFGIQKLTMRSIMNAMLKHSNLVFKPNIKSKQFSTVASEMMRIGVFTVKPDINRTVAFCTLRNENSAGFAAPSQTQAKTPTTGGGMVTGVTLMSSKDRSSGMVNGAIPMPSKDHSTSGSETDRTNGNTSIRKEPDMRKPSRQHTVEYQLRLPNKQQVEKYFFRVVAFIYDLTYLIVIWATKTVDQHIVKNEVVQEYWKKFHEKMDKAKKD